MNGYTNEPYGRRVVITKIIKDRRKRNRVRARKHHRRRHHGISTTLLSDELPSRIYYNFRVFLPLYFSVRIGSISELFGFGDLHPAPYGRYLWNLFPRGFQSI